MRFYIFIVVGLFSAHVTANNEEFLRPLHGMKGLSIVCDTEEKISLVRSYVENPNFDFLSMTKGDRAEIKVLVSADSLDEFETALIKHRIDYTVFIENAAREVREEYVRNQLARYAACAKDKGSSRIFKYFPRLAEIHAYFRELAKTYKDIVTILNIGTSYLGNPIYVVKISSGGPSEKPAIFIDAGIHAREWIAPTTALYAIDQLVVNKTNSPLYENVDWYILPCLNPDGYEYTHTSYRMWRKTRSANRGSKCYGTDANRNFAYKWMTTGASSDPCSDIYAGYKAFSESETVSLSKFIVAEAKSIKAYLTLHSYGQYMLHPWGYTSKLPENEPQLRSVAIEAEKALAAVRGTRYTIGSSTNVLYAAAGGSDDWVMALCGVPLSYTIELPAGGSTGFNPPASSIEPVGFETFEAFKVFGRYVASEYAVTSVQTDLDGSSHLLANSTSSVWDE